MATPFRLKRSAVADRRPTTTDLQLGELALNTHDGFLYAETTGVGSTVSLLTPWREQYGSPTSIYYNHRVGIGSTNPTVSLDVVGDTILQSNLDVAGIATLGSGGSGYAELFYQGVKKFETESWGTRTTGTVQALNGNLSIFKSHASNTGQLLLQNQTGDAFEIGHTSSNSFITGHVGNISINAPQVSISTNFSVGGISTFTNTVNINGVIEANSNLNVDGNLDVDGQTNLDDLAVSGISTFTSTTTQSDHTNKALQVRNNSATNTFAVSYRGQGYFATGIGIGTDSPSAPFHISGADANSARLIIEDNNNGFAPSDIRVQNGGRDLRIAAPVDIFFQKLTSGTPVLYLENGNAVGIATNSPQATLDVFGNTKLRNDVDISGALKVVGVGTFGDKVKISSNVNALSAPSVAGNYHLHLTNPQNDAGETVGIAFGLSTGGDIGAAITHEREGSNSIGNLRFYTKENTSSASMQERMRISKEGNVGIGTDDPGTNLHISGSGAGQNNLRIDSSGTAIAFNDHSEFMGFIGNDSGKLFINAGGTQDTLSLRTGGVEKVHIESSGDVGIGTDNAISKLHVGGTFSVITQSILTDQSHTSAARGGNALFVSNNSTVETARFYCSAAGNTKIHIECSSNNGDSELHFCDQEDRTTGGTFHYEKSSGKIIYEHDNDAFKFDTNRTEKLRIMSSGDVGIGTNNPTGSNALTSNTAVLAVGIVTTNSHFIRDLNVTGISTFSGDVHIGSAVLTNPSGSANVDFNGAILASDIITAGALLHEGDTDTLVHFSAANTIELKTGGFSRLSVSNFGVALQTNATFNVNGGRIILGDSTGGTNDDRIVLGNDNDCFLYHDSVNSYIENNTGILKILGNTIQLGDGTDKVGINSTSPTHELEVLGDTLLKGNLSVTGISTFSGNVNVSGLSKRLLIGDITGTPVNHLAIQQVSGSSVRGFATQYDNGSVFENLQGSIHQHLVLGDSNYDNSNTIFGISITDSGTTYERLKLTGVGDLTVARDLNVTRNLSVDGRTELDITNISETLNVTGISTFTSQVGFGTHIILEDYSQIRLGEKVSGGNRVGDFFIDHNPTLFGGVYNELVSTNGNILLENRDTGANKFLYLKADRVQIRSYTGNESFITCQKDADVSLFYDNSERFKTTTYGALLTGGTSGIGTLAAPATFHIDPAAVGDNTGTVVIKGNLQIDGTTTTVNSTTVTVDDKNLVLASGAANDAAASGGGITIESGDGNKTFTFESTGNSFQSSEHFRVASGKVIGFAAHTGTFLSASASGGFVFTIGNNEKARIRSSGDVNLGANLNVVGVSTFTGKVAISTFATGGELADTHLLVKGGVTFSEFTSSGEGHLPAITQFSESGAQDLAIGTRSSGGDLLFFTGNVNSGTANFGTNLNQLRLRIHHDGEATFSKTVGISSNLNVAGIGTIGSGGSGYAELQHQGVKKLETTSGGVDVFNIVRCLGGTAPRIQFFGDVNGVDTNTRATFGLATGANHIVSGSTTNDVVLNTPHRFIIGHATNEIMAKFDPDGAAELYFDAVKRLETTDTGVGISSNLTVSGVSTFSDDTHFKDTVRFQDASGSSKVNFFTFGRLQFNDNVQAAFGNSSQGRIGSDGSHLTIANNTGGSYTGTGNIKIQADAGKESIVGIQSGAVEAYYNGEKRFSTSGIGATVHGQLDSTQLTVSGVSTFSDTVKIGTGVTALTDGNVSIGGTFEIFESSGIANRNFSQFKLSNFSIGQHQNTGAYKIINSSTGHLLLGGGNGGNGGIVLYNNVLSAKYLRANSEGSVEIFHDNVLHFETSGIGVTVYGQLDSTQLTVSGVSTFHGINNISGEVNIGDSATGQTTNRLRIGASADIQIYHDSSTTNNHFIAQNGLFYLQNDNLRITALNAAKPFVQGNVDSSVKLFYASNEKISTSGVGVTVYNQLDTTNIYATGITTSVGTFHIRPTSGALSPKISYVDSIADAMIWADNVEARFGGSSDFRIYHDTTGDLNILETHLDREVHIREVDGTNIAKFIPGGSVELYENGTKRLETTDTGVGISSNLTVSGVSTFQDDVTLSKNNPTITLSDTNNNPDYQIGNINGALRFQDTTNNKTKFIANTNGRVGIGTDNPLRDFHVIGTSRFEQLDVVGFTTFATGTRFFHHTPQIFMQGSNTATLSFVNQTTGTTVGSDGMLMGFSSSSQVGFINVNEAAHGFVLKTGSSGQSSERIRVSGVGTFSIRNGTEEMVNARPNSAVELYFNGNKRLETTNTGVDITDTLKVAGISTFTGVINSTVSTGTAPFTVASTTKVTNLNADLLDGKSTANGAAGNSVVVRNAAAGFSAGDVTFANITAGITTNTGVINSQTDIRINNVSVIETALNDAVAMAIALG